MTNSMVNAASYAQSAYISADISTLTPLDLVIKLYDGAISFMAKAVAAINRKERLQKLQYINKARMIIEELLHSLNVEEGGEVSLNLVDLYSYMLIQLTKANATDDIEKINHVQDLMKTLRSAWVELKHTMPNEKSGRKLVSRSL